MLNSKATAPLQSHSIEYQSRCGEWIAWMIILCWLAHLVFLMLAPIHLIFVLPHILLQSFLCTGLFINAHEAMHGLVSPQWPGRNRFLGALSIFLYGGFSFSKLQSAHLLHHQSPATLGDPDFTSHRHEKFGPWLFEFARRYFGWPEYFKMHLHIFLLWILGGSLLKVILFFAVPAWASALQLFYFGTYLPHRNQQDSPCWHRARSNSLPAWLSLLTCYHFGYHDEHHKYPSVPWWRLPKLRWQDRNKKCL